jgi:pimeloyl-ACP methyl ester carboxylesterase
MMINSTSKNEFGQSDVEHHYAEVADTRVHFVTAGSGEPLVLLHGWPETWWSWRKVIPEFAKHYRVIAPDLRGLGDSSRPAEGFDKKRVAADVATLLQETLNIKKAAVVGHDWGGPVAFALAAFHPGLVTKLVMLDAAVPGDGAGTYSQAGRRWHHAFHQTLDLPEQLIEGREEPYYRWFFENYGYDRSAMTEADVQEYLRTYKSRSTLRTGLGYYRAIPQDTRDNEAFLKNDRLNMPILAYGGSKAFGRGEEGFTSLQRVGTNVQGGLVPACGHWIQEERPDFVLENALPFLRST